LIIGLCFAADNSTTTHAARKIPAMFGSIIGDVAGSTYEYAGCKDPTVPLFPPESSYTDDSILTVATAEVLLRGGDYAETYRRYGRKYRWPMGGYGASFAGWLDRDGAPPYDSYGNGAAMRVGPVGLAMPTLDAVMAEARRSASVTHDHPEGVRGAQATASAVFMAKTGASKAQIRDHVAQVFGYDLDRTVEQIRPSYSFNETCQRTVPEAIVAFLDSNDYESALRLAISLGGDADTLACITGGIADAFYRQIPQPYMVMIRRHLSPKLLLIVDEFMARHPQPVEK
jgi:ADP-ribosyl-[dinitrogen reductase] hydrolase